MKKFSPTPALSALTWLVFAYVASSTTSLTPSSLMIHCASGGSPKHALGTRVCGTLWLVSLCFNKFSLSRPSLPSFSLILCGTRGGFSWLRVPQRAGAFTRMHRLIWRSPGYSLFFLPVFANILTRLNASDCVSVYESVDCFRESDSHSRAFSSFPFFSSCFIYIFFKIA